MFLCREGGKEDESPRIRTAAFRLGQKVSVKGRGIGGKIIGIWFDLYGDVQYYVKYWDKTDCRRHTWMPGEDLL